MIVCDSVCVCVCVCVFVSLIAHGACATSQQEIFDWAHIAQDIRRKSIIVPLGCDPTAGSSQGRAVLSSFLWPGEGGDGATVPASAPVDLHGITLTVPRLDPCSPTSRLQAKQGRWIIVVARKVGIERWVGLATLTGIISLSHEAVVVIFR